MFTRMMLVFFCTALACSAADAGPTNMPNILIILADDLGYSDIGCYGGEIKTPNLDALAANGIRFSQSYNSSRCCPTRASLLTGLYPHQAGIGAMTGGTPSGPEGYIGRLHPQAVTLAEVLAPAGYARYACGKWHVNEPGPVQRGFEEFYGFTQGYGVDSWNPNMMIRLPSDRKPRTYPQGTFYATTALTDHALDFIEIARNTKSPFLLYLAYQVAHFPVQAPQEIVEKYVPTYEKGWDLLRTERFERIKKLGLVPAHAALPPRSPIDNSAVAKRLGSMTPDGINPAWDTLDAKRRADLARRMATYAAMVECMDTGIGRIVEALKRQGDLENTLIIFLSDNGACAEWEPFGFDLEAKAFAQNAPGQGINVGTPGKPNILHEGETLQKMGGPGSLFSYGCAWANFSNTPLWLYKHYTHEGGIRTPMIAHWPAKIVGKGEWRPHLTHITDIMATCIDISGAHYPETFNNRKIAPYEGRSLLPAFTNQPETPRTLVFEHERNGALREGAWKLVGQNVFAKNDFAKDAKWELYNITTDVSEQTDLAKQHPERVEKMKMKLLEEARRTHILPKP